MKIAECREYEMFSCSGKKSAARAKPFLAASRSHSG